MDWKRITILLFLPAVLFQSCGGSELAPEERDVTLDRPLLEWRPALRADIPGFYVSREIEGEAAASVLSMEYLFQEDGSYTGAALVLDENGRPSFQTLSGTWRLEESRLVLDDSEPAEASVAGDHLRLTAPTGTVILVRRPLT